MVHRKIFMLIQRCLLIKLHTDTSTESLGKCRPGVLSSLLGRGDVPKDPLVSFRFLFVSICKIKQETFEKLLVHRHLRRSKECPHQQNRIVTHLPQYLLGYQCSSSIITLYSYDILYRGQDSSLAQTPDEEAESQGRVSWDSAICNEAGGPWEKGSVHNPRYAQPRQVWGALPATHTADPSSSVKPGGRFGRVEKYDRNTEWLHKKWSLVRIGAPGCWLSERCPMTYDLWPACSDL